MERKTALITIICTAFALFTTPGFSQTTYSWDFNEGSGNAVKDSSGKYSAKLGLGVDESQSPSGKVDDRSVWPLGGLKVDDSNNPAFTFQNGPLTIEAWINPSEFSGYTDLMDIGNSIKVGFSNNTFVFTLLGIIDDQTDATIPVDGNWHHIAYIWNPGVDVSYYLDGELAQTIAETQMPRNFDRNEMTIGSAHGGGSNFFGRIDRVRVHSAILTPAQLDSDAKNPKAASDKTVVAYNFDEAVAPYKNSTVLDRPAVLINPAVNKSNAPAFTLDTPAGKEGDYSLSFDGNDRVTYDDRENFFFDFVNEPFTFQVWMKFKADKQTADRPVFFSYGHAGEGGYSFSFRPANPAKFVSSPSGKIEDKAVNTTTGLLVDDSKESVLNLPNGPLTTELWVNPTLLTGYTDLFRIGNSIKLGFFEDKLVWTFLGVEDVESGVALKTGVWQHVAVVWEAGTKVTFFVDGVEAASKDTANTAREFTVPNLLSIGSDPDGASKYVGSIDRLRIHNVALPADQLDSDPAVEKAPLSSTLAAYTFNEVAEPFKNSAAADLPAVSRNPASRLTVTTFGIVDAHSNAQIPDDGGWHHVASVLDLDAGEFRFYVDGKLSDTYKYEGGVNPFNTQYAFLHMGSEENGWNAYIGLLDRLRIVRGVLTPDKLDYFTPVTALLEWSLY